MRGRGIEAERQLRDFVGESTDDSTEHVQSLETRCIHDEGQLWRGRARSVESVASIRSGSALI